MRILFVFALLSFVAAPGPNSSLANAGAIGDAQGYVTTDSVRSEFDLLAKLTAQDGFAGEGLGNGVAIDGDTITVGAQSKDNGRGAVYVFIKPASGWQTTSTYAAKLVPSDGAAGDQFGSPIALRGDTIVVGAHVADVDGKADQGAAYVFVKPAGGWIGTVTESAKLTAFAGAADDLFGVQAEIDETGNVIVVGAHHVENSRGAAYVFLKPVGGWKGHRNENARLAVRNGEAGDFFGRGLGISGDTIAVGAYGVHGWSGRAYVFVKPIGGWNGIVHESAQLNFSTRGYAEFGNVVKVKDHTVVVGAYAEGGWRGAAYVYVKPAGGWSGSRFEDARLTASDANPGDFFGYNSLALDGNRIVVGAHQDEVNGNAEQGSAYVFLKPAGGWTGNLIESLKLTAPDGAAGDWFGLALGLSGEDIVIGAHLSDIGTDPDRGAAYVLHAGQVVEPQADLELVKRVSTTVTRTKPLRFVLSVKNLGPDRADNVVITDMLPPDLQVIRVTSRRAKCVFDTQSVTCTVNALDANARARVRLSVRYTGQSEMFKNCAQVRAAALDLKPENNRACVADAVFRDGKEW